MSAPAPPAVTPGRGDVIPPLPPHRVLLRRMLASTALMLVMIAFSLVIGVLGYHYIAGDRSWWDALVDASMILGGEGPIRTSFETRSAKLFVSAYAIYSGVALISSVGVFLGPLVHRFLHRFHLDLDEDRQD